MAGKIIQRGVGAFGNFPDRFPTGRTQAGRIHGALLP